MKNVNALKRSINYLVMIFTENFNMDEFEIIKSCGKLFDLIKLETICILIRKPKLCRQNGFDYMLLYLLIRFSLSFMVYVSL